MTLARPVEHDLAAEALAAKPISHWKLAWWRLSRDKVTLVAGSVLVLIILAAALAPIISPYDPNVAHVKENVVDRMASIGSSGHPLGTDEQGRDMVSRLLYGGRMSLLAGVVPVFFALLIACVLGITAGFVGGWLNMLIMRVTDMFYAFPFILLAIAISGALGPGLNNTLIALTIVFIPPITRVAESVTTQVRAMDFVESAQASGAGNLSIIRYHIVANVAGPIVIYASTLVGVSIIAAAGLSFLGLGVSVPNAEWGLMLSQLRQSIYIEPWVPALPGLMIFLTSMSFNLLSDGLRDALDVRL
jgi:peptide/nickel transport system permease protein